MCFIFAELGTTGNQDANGQLVLKGKVIFSAFRSVSKLMSYFSSMLKVWKRFYVSISKISFDVKLVCPPRPLSIKEIDFTSSSAINANRKLFFSTSSQDNNSTI